MVGIRSVSAVAKAVLIMTTASIILFTEDSDAYTNTYTLEFETGEDINIDLTGRKGPILSERGGIRQGELVEFTVRCPNHDIAFDLIQTIDERYFPDEDQDFLEASL